MKIEMRVFVKIFNILRIDIKKICCILFLNSFFCEDRKNIICIYIYIYIYLGPLLLMEGGRKQDRIMHSLLSPHPHLRPMRLRTRLHTWVRAVSKAPISETGPSEQGLYIFLKFKMTIGNYKRPSDILNFLNILKRL